MMRKLTHVNTHTAAAPSGVRGWALRGGLWAAVVIVAALAQTTWPAALKIQQVAPDLVLLLVVYFGTADGEERAMYTGLLGGIYQDTAGQTVLGHHVLCNVLIGYAVGRIATRLVFIEHPAVKAVLVLCASLAHGALFTLIRYVQEPDFGAIMTLLTSVVPGAFYTALVTPLAFFLLARLFHARDAAPGGPL